MVDDGGQNPDGAAAAESAVERGSRRAEVTSGEPGRPYHLIVPPGSGWWRPLVGTVVIAVGWYFALVALVVVVGSAVPSMSARTDRPFSEQLGSIVLGLAIVAAALPMVALAAHALQHRSLGTVSSVRGRLRLPWLAACAGVAAGVCLVQLVVGALLPDPTGGGSQEGGSAPWPGAGVLANAIVLVVLLVPVQAAAEEYVARGWLVQMMGTWTGRAWPGVLLGGVVWTALHTPTTWWAVADLMVTSVVYGWLVWRTGGLEATIAQHAVNNIAGFLVLTITGQLSAALGTANAGNADWTAVVTDVVVLPLYAWVTVRVHTRMKLSRRTAASYGPVATEIPPP
jgi:uncharacterized protein